MERLAESGETVSEYNELIAHELEDVSLDIIGLLQDAESFNKRGVAAMMLTSASMLDAMADGKKPTREDTLAVTECLNKLGKHPGALALLLGQIGKMLGMMHLGFYEQVRK